MTKLCPLEPKSPLLLYVSASNSAVSAVLVQEKEEEGKLKQIPVTLLPKLCLAPRSSIPNWKKSRMRSLWQQGS
jgi:hypothetical protein